jgi:hypothetical protein
MTMDAKREKILIEGALESSCYKSGKLFIQGEILTRDKFKELFLSGEKIPEDICTNCPSMMVVETDYGDEIKCSFLIDYLASKYYCYRCSFVVKKPGGKHAESAYITTNVLVEEWERNKPIDYMEFEFP